MSLIFSMVLGLPAILVAITVHEYAHAYAALKMGDPTAKMAGRLTLNPIKHIDILGLIVLLLARIGWAKPVPVNPFYFKNPQRDEALVSLAGPASNLALAIPVGLLLRVLFQFLPGAPGIVVSFFYLIFLYNIVLFAFNLIPIPPLDGSKILFSLLPRSYRINLYQLDYYGPYILFGLILFDRITGANLFWSGIQAVINLFSSLIIGIGNF